MFRALKHEGIAAGCLFELLAGGRRMSSEQKLQAFAACAVIAKSLQSMRGDG